MEGQAPVTDEKHLYVSWEDYHLAIERLAQVVYTSGWKFDQILCLARGGLRLGDVFSRIFCIPLAILSTSSYRAESGTVQGELDIGQFITITNGSLAGKVLLLDDLVDSGITLKKVQYHIAEKFPLVTEIKSAVIWCKGCSSVQPDFFLEYLEANPWIHQPFEEYDNIRPHQLASWMKKGGELKNN